MYSYKPRRVPDSGYDLPKVITERKSSEGRKESSCPNVPVHHLLVSSGDDILMCRAQYSSAHKHRPS